MSDKSLVCFHVDKPTTIEDLPNDVLIRVLSLLGASSLAAVRCASSGLRSLSSDPSMWSHLCMSTWPSLNHPRVLSLSIPPHSFFSDAISFPSPSVPQFDTSVSSIHLPKELVSAVDIYHDGKPIFSRVMETDTSCPWFLGSPFRLDAIDRKPLEEVILPGGLTLSWITIDPNRNRAVNLSSQTPVSIYRDLYTAEVVVRFAVVLANSLVSISVTCSEKTGNIKEVTLTIEDEEGSPVNGEGGLVILTRAMEGERRNGGKEKAEGRRRRYEEFVSLKRRRKESMATELLVDFLYSLTGFLVFLYIVVMVVFT